MANYCAFFYQFTARILCVPFHATFRKALKLATALIQGVQTIYALFTVICIEYKWVNNLRNLVRNHNMDEFNSMVEKVGNEGPKDILAVWEAGDEKKH